MKKNTYYVPVETKSTSILIVNAITQSDAVAQVEAIIAKNESLADKYDSVRIVTKDIECKEDDEMLKQLSEDFPADTIGSNCNA